MHTKTAKHLDIDIIKTIADRMRDPLFVKETILDPNNINPEPFFEMDRWDGLSMVGGYTGVLPLFVELDRLFPDEKWDLVGHAYVLKIVKALETEGVQNLSLFAGLAGLSFYLWQASKNGTRYKKVLDKLDNFLIGGVVSTHIAPLKAQIDQSIPCDNRFYETIQGLSGIGIYALQRPDKQEFKELVHRIINLFIDLSRPIEVKGKEVPGWYVSPDFFFLDAERVRCPDGNFNLGLSHGVPGVLAFLSIAKIHQIELEGQKEAIRTISSWLCSKRKSINGRFFWDATISFKEEISSPLPPEHKTKDAWCYGTPGVSRTLYLAGKALEDRALKAYALEAFTTIFNSAKEKWQLLGPTICHGIAGLLMITHLMAKDSGSKILKEQTEKLREILMSYYSPSFPFGFRNGEPYKTKMEEIAWLDQADLLEGATGVLLTLLSLHSEGYNWHLPFLIDA